MLHPTACEEARWLGPASPTTTARCCPSARRYAREGVIKARKLPNSNRHYVLKSELMEWLKSQPVVSDVGDEVEELDRSRD
jgi:hypothetical protein